MLKKFLVAFAVGLAVGAGPCKRANAESGALYLPSLGANATGTTVGAKKTLDVSIPAGLSITDPAEGANGAVIPGTSILIGGSDGTDLRPLSVDSTGKANLNNISGTISLPTGAATSANQTTANTSLSSIDGKITTTVNGIKVDVQASALPSGAATSAKQDTGNTSLSSIDGKLASLGQKAMTGSAPVVISSDQSAIPVSQNGTWNITNVSGTVSLPTGAATSANQSTGNTSLASITTNTSKQPINTTGSGSAAGATVSTVITITHPANAVGFILMNLDTSTANIRWAVGRTASTTLGQQLQPGRDTGFVPIGADISIIAESGTQNYDVQFISQ